MIKSKYRLQDFLKTLKNGKQVLDFRKIEKAGAVLNVLLTQRGSLGKTFNVKELIREDYLKHKAKAVWLMNTEGLIEKQVQDMTADFEKVYRKGLIPKSTVDFWRGLKYTGKIDKATAHYRYKDDKVIHMLQIGHAELMKGAREDYRRIVYDEFNVKANTGKNIVNLFGSLLGSMEDLVANHKKQQDLKIHIFGNTKSLNNPLLTNLGIRTLTHEISEIRDQYGKLLVLVIAPQFNSKDREQLEIDNKDNAIFQLQKQLGTAKHSYFNETLEDEINFVKRYTDTKAHSQLLQPIISIYHNDNYLNVYKVKNMNNQFHCVLVPYEDRIDPTYAFARKDLKEDVVLNTVFRKRFSNILQASKITFEDVISRDNFVSSITK